MDDAANDPYAAHVATIAAAYLGNPTTRVDKSDLAEVIQAIRAALTPAPSEPEAPAPEAAPAPEKPSPAAIRRSITPDHLISFIDGRGYKTMKRHLTTHGFTPESYRERFGLKPDYPMSAPNYSAQRAELARSIGLGQRGRAAAAATPAKAAKAPARTRKAKAAPAEA